MDTKDNAASADSELIDAGTAGLLSMPHNFPDDISDLLDIGAGMGAIGPIELPDGTLVFMLGEKMRPHAIPPLNPKLPDFVTADEIVVEPDSFKLYIQRFGSSTTILTASLKRNQIRAALDYHGQARVGDGAAARDTALPQRCKHFVTLECPFDIDYAKWRPVLFGLTKFDQGGLAEFIEDTIHTIHQPPAADLLEAISDLQMARSVKFKSQRNEQDGTFSLAYEEVDAADPGQAQNGKLRLPKEIEIITPIFQGGPRVSLRAKLRHALDKGQVVFRFAVPGLDNEERIAFRSIGDDAAAVTKAPIFYTA